MTHFQLAFETQTEHVDLLEFHYANFLINKGEIEEGMKYLTKAIEKGEPEAIKRLEELKKE